jgi:NAD(P)-dependent dehydrogenase (short-subunit alcohol dehydrogenase family)
MEVNKEVNRIQPLFRLDGKVAVVTGASKGIGESIARGFAEFGAKVIISSRKQDAVDAVAKSFREDGLEATGIACHVGDEEQIQQLIDKTIELYGKIDILVNNAAINPVFAPIKGVEAQVFDKIMDINVKAPFIFSNKVYPIMKEAGGGSIIHISSVEGMKPSFGLGLYSVSKAALTMLTKNQAKEWGKDKIRVNAICPGLIKTKFSSALWQNEAILNQVEQHLPLGRMALPDEMAGLALYLASEAASYCTGSIFTADGGHMLI